MWIELLTTRAVAHRVGKANIAPTELTNVLANFAVGTDHALTELQITFAIAHLVSRGIIVNTIHRARCRLPFLPIMLEAGTQISVWPED